MPGVRRVLLTFSHKNICPSLNLSESLLENRFEISFLKVKRKVYGWEEHRLIVYKVNNRQSEILQEESNTVLRIFQQTITGTTPLLIATQLNEKKYTTKSWVSQKGNPRGGKQWTSKQIYRVIKIPIYIAKVKHKEELYDGEHPPIMTDDVWYTAKNIMTQKN